MEILASGWLQRMANKAGNTPQSRIAALFDILQEWMEAPGLRQALEHEPLMETDQREIQVYFLALCRETGVADPEAVCSQLLSILLGAVHQELHMPGCRALEQAGNAAMLLLTRQRKRSQSRWRVAAPAAAAVFVVTMLLPSLAIIPESAVQPPGTAVITAAHAVPDELDPDQLAAVYHMHEKISSAQCAYPQALMLPSEQRAVFLEYVVSGDGENFSPRTLELVSQLYRKVECYYPPAALL